MAQRPSRRRLAKSSGAPSTAAAAASFAPPLGGFHKTLGHDAYGEVTPQHYADLTQACLLTRANANESSFNRVPRGVPSGVPPAMAIPPGAESATLTNPLAGLALDPLVPPPETFSMPGPPDVTSLGTAAELTELYWMALLRDLPIDLFEADPRTLREAGRVNEANLVELLQKEAIPELNKVFDGQNDLQQGTDLPCGPFTAKNVFRVGMPGEEVGPLISQFFVRDAAFGVQTISQKMTPYRRGLNFLTTFEEWLYAQNTGRGPDGNAYPKSNEKHPMLYLEGPPRYASCMRDLARFVNKDALHQAYFTASLQLLGAGALWTPGNPYFYDFDPKKRRDSGFGTLGGPHILALVSEVATRALQTVWYQKWQTWLRLRPEAYAGHLHVQTIGAPGQTPATRPYGLQAVGSFGKDARRRIESLTGTLLLPMAFTSGSPAHPSYGAGHATVAGACITVLKAFFRVLDSHAQPLPLSSLNNFAAFATGIDSSGAGTLEPIPFGSMTIEGELNKLAMNVAMGRSMGGVHWRSDNTRSLMLGEAIAVHVLASISRDLVEHPRFQFRTFGQVKTATTCRPKLVEIGREGVTVDGASVDLRTGSASLSRLV